jgi:uncharacterized membrane protein YjgN (DUF898 family)
MSYQITFSSWSGSSKKESAKKLAKVFQLQNENSVAIVDNLNQGLPWRFDRSIPDHQANLASTYLRSLGFVVDIHPVEGEIQPLSNAVVIADVQETEKVLAHDDSYKFNFLGHSRTLLNISFTNLIKTVLSIGIYWFWAKTNVRQYIWDQTVFMGDRFSYHGTGKELLNTAFKFGGIIALLGVINIYIMFNIGTEENQQFFKLLSFLVVIMIPVFLVGGWKYKLSRTTWRSIRFSFRGKRVDAFTLYLLGVLISILTLGLYWPFFKIKSERFWREHFFLGNVPFRFSGVGKEFFNKFIVAILLIPLTLGFYVFWFVADLKRYLWSHTHVLGATFHFPIKSQDYMKLKIANFFILLFTLGMGFSWTMVRNQRFVTDNLVIVGNIELNRIIHEQKISEGFEVEALDAIESPIDFS